MRKGDATLEYHLNACMLPVLNGSFMCQRVVFSIATTVRTTLEVTFIIRFLCEAAVVEKKILQVTKIEP